MPFEKNQICHFILALVYIMSPFSTHLVVCAAAELSLGAVLGFGGDLVTSFKIMEDQGLQFMQRIAVRI